MILMTIKPILFLSFPATLTEEGASGNREWYSMGSVIGVLFGFGKKQTHSMLQSGVSAAYKTSPRLLAF